MTDALFSATWMKWMIYKENNLYSYIFNQIVSQNRRRLPTLCDSVKGIIPSWLESKIKWLYCWRSNCQEGMGIILTGVTPSHMCAFPKPIIEFSFCVQLFEVRGGCSSFWYLWNAYPSLTSLKLSFHNIHVWFLLYICNGVWYTLNVYSISITQNVSLNILSLNR